MRSSAGIFEQRDPARQSSAMNLRSGGAPHGDGSVLRPSAAKAVLVAGRDSPGPSRCRGSTSTTVAPPRKPTLGTTHTADLQADGESGGQTERVSAPPPLARARHRRYAFAYGAGSPSGNCCADS